MDKKLVEHLNILLLCIATVILIGLQIKTLGWIILLSGLFVLFFCRKEFSRDLSLLYLAIIILGVTPLNPNINLNHVVALTLSFSSVVLIPYFISKYIFKDHSIKFKFKRSKGKYKFKLIYLLIILLVTYFVLPFYFKTTLSYLNWQFLNETDYLIKIFIGINVVGVWDELFFIGTVLAILRKHLNFNLANFAQAVIFSAVLYDLGFRSWGFLIIFALALSQGYAFRKTNSLFFVVAVHLAADALLFLTLLNAHFPNWIPIFLTSYF